MKPRPDQTAQADSVHRWSGSHSYRLGSDAFLHRALLSRSFEAFLGLGFRGLWIDGGNKVRLLGRVGWLCEGSGKLRDSRLSGLCGWVRVANVLGECLLG